MKGFNFISKSRISKIPKVPGVYAFKNSEILYIGKASNLKERVKNHFQQPSYRDNLFIDKVERMGFIKTDSEIEALILEAKLIKKYQPKFNVLWKDDKNYFYVAFTKENFPKVFITHQPKNLISINYIGPFVDGNALKQTLKLLRKIFPHRSCQKIPKKPCLWYELKRCPAPCLFKNNLGKQIPGSLERIERESQKNVKNILKIFQGEKKQVLNNLMKEMRNESRNQNFEKAAKIRDQTEYLKKILSHKIFLENNKNLIEWGQIQEKIQETLKTKNNLNRIEAYDISNFQGKESVGSMIVFIKGLPDKNFYRRFKINFDGKPDDVAMLKEVLSRRFKHQEWQYPNLILIDGGKAQLNAALNTVKNYKIIFMALAKKKNELFIEGRKNPILLKNISSRVSNLILQIRDEAHRFAITYHRKLREKKFFS
jgi:excinuclease ABC subunit C